MSQADHSDVKDFFIKPSVSKGLFLWFAFRQFIERGSVLTVSSEQGTPQSLMQWLTLWQQQEYHASNNYPGNTGMPWWFNLVSLLLGALAMLGVLVAHAGSAINIWAPLFLFAFLPFALSLFTGFLPLIVASESRSKPLGYELFAKRLNLPEFDSHRLLLQPWISWQIQKAAGFALLGGLLCFFVFATFQQVSFYWSSTFITDSNTMAQLFYWIALPWQWWLEAPSLELVTASQHRLTESVNLQGHSSALWQFIVLAVICYGLLPRLLLIALFRGQLKNRLSQSINVSSVFEQFLNRQQQMVSIEPVMPDSDEQLNTDANSVESGEAASATDAFTANKVSDPLRSEEQHDGSEHRVQRENGLSAETEMISDKAGLWVGWRLAESESRIEKNLGTGSWQDDESWLTSLSITQQQPLLLKVEAWQTPTGELADILEIIKSQQLSVEIVVIGLNEQTERADMMAKTWQFFAKQNGVPCQIVSSDQQEGYK